MLFTRPITDEDSAIDFYAGSDEAVSQLKSVYDVLPPNRQGKFYSKEFGNYLPGVNPLVITNPADLALVFYAGEERPFVLLEYEHHTSINGLLSTVSLFLCKEDKTFNLRNPFIGKDQLIFKYVTPEDAANQLIAYVVGKNPKHRAMLNKDSIGLLYMSFGDKAAQAIKHSIATLRRVGFSYPVCVVGDTPVPKCKFVMWTRESPFDPTQKANFQFRAGRVKPFLYGLSPFDRTLYIDADTEFVEDIHAGFEMLDENDIALTREYLTVGQLYNKSLAGWEINIEERAQSIKEGIPPDEGFINSGVIFFKKSKNAQSLFQDWYSQWMRYQQWDEQLALMRSLMNSPVKCKYLSPAWNDPHPNEDTIIFHNYGRAVVRMYV